MKLLRLVRNVAIALFAALLFVTVFFGGPSDSDAVNMSAPARPIASFSVQASGLSVTVDASESSAADGHTIARYEWDWDYDPNDPASFEGESTELAIPPAHKYEKAGTYIVGLRVYQNDGRFGEAPWQAVSVDGVAPAAATEPAPAPAPACAATWQMGADAADGNVTEEVPEILGAQSNDDASAAMVVWMDKVKPHPGTLAGAAAFFLHRQVDPTTLVDAQGCATPAAVALDQELRLTIAAGTPRPEDAPENGTNSGLVGGLIMASTGPGIDGNRKAVAITLPDGSVVWVMGRCGNPVVLGTSPVPASPLAPAPVTPPAPAPEVPTPGTTPGTPPPGTTTPPETCPPDMPYGTPPYCKDGPSHDVLLNPDVPAQVRGPQGSAPTGPASVPTDSPSGCPGTCQNSATASAPVANTRMTQSVVPDPPQVQAPVTAVPTIPATAVATGPAGGTCGVDAMGIPVDDC